MTIVLVDVGQARLRSISINWAYGSPVLLLNKAPSPTAMLKLPEVLFVKALEEFIICSFKNC